MEKLPRHFSINDQIEASHFAFNTWKDFRPSKRAEAIQRLSYVLESEKNRLATAITTETGKPIRQSRAEVSKCEQLCSYYAANADVFLKERIITTSESQNRIIVEPLGLIFGTMPWNFPVWQSLRFAIPALLAGNTVLVKLAENTSGCARLLRTCFDKAEFVNGVYMAVFPDYKETEEILGHPLVRGFSFTGSTESGRHLSEIASRNLLKTVLELGGSDPYIVLRGADLDKAAKACVESRLTNSGQSCISAKRFIVEEDVYEEFVQRFVAFCKTKVVGDPFDEKTDVGPLAKLSSKQMLTKQVGQSIEMGARLSYTSESFGKDERFFPITVLSDVPRHSPVFTQETFGPVAAITAVDDIEEAIQVANASRYGLGAAVFSKDLNLGIEVAKRLESGMCAINRAVQSHWELPFGGVKNSGFGKELGAEGFRSFINQKVVMIDSESFN